MKANCVGCKKTARAVMKKSARGTFAISLTDGLTFYSMKCNRSTVTIYCANCRKRLDSFRDSLHIGA